MALLGYGVVALRRLSSRCLRFGAAREGAAAFARRELADSGRLALFRRNQRRYGGYIVHLGVTVIGIGVIGKFGIPDRSAAYAGAGRY